MPNDRARFCSSDEPRASARAALGVEKCRGIVHTHTFKLADLPRRFAMAWKSRGLQPARCSGFGVGPECDRKAAQAEACGSSIAQLVSFNHIDKLAESRRPPRRGIMRFMWCSGCVLLGIAVHGCGEDRPPPAPPAASQPTFDVPTYARYLEGVKICLDPGHGGRADRPGYKRGPTGLQEAEVNLRVAHFLREFLETSGAVVLMTRRDDVYLHVDDDEDLRLRAEVANTNDCDIFLSIHHNAGGRAGANFSSVWYHGEVDHSPASLDVARYVSSALIDELRLPEHLGCPVLSDELMYPGRGFAVLRHARVPAVLSEASFHSNPQEEERLRDPLYNRREAHALFLALARYAYGGIPRARLVEPADGTVAADGPRKIVIELDDGIRSRKSWGWQRRLIPQDSVRVRIGDRQASFSFDQQTARVTASLPAALPPGPVSLSVQFENLFRHSNTRPIVPLRIAAPPGGAGLRSGCDQLFSSNSASMTSSSLPAVAPAVAVGPA